jgi:catechol 2,3-dioxygenase-like lactoylglutathione lyase family enzyme
MFTHICIGAQDLTASKQFYDATLGALGVASIGQINDHACLYATDTGKILLTTPQNGEPAAPSNGGMVGFAAADEAAVDAFHAAGLANGGSCEGPPGSRANAPGQAYGAYLRDPMGNKMSAFAPPPAA